MTTQSFKSRRRASSSRRLGFEVVARARLNLLVKVITLIRLITWGAPVLDWAEQTQSLLLAEQAQSSWPNHWTTDQGCPLAKTLTEQAQSFWAHLLDNRQGVIHARRPRVTQRGIRSTTSEPYAMIIQNVSLLLTQP